MSVPDQPSVVVHTGNGVTTDFPYGFYVLSLDDLVVSQDGVAQTSGYTVTGIGSQTGGIVTFAVPPADQVKIQIHRDVKIERLTDYQRNGDFRAQTVNMDFDRVWMALQDFLRDKLGTIHYSVFESLNGELPGPGERALMVLSWADNGAQSLVPIPAQFGAGDLKRDKFYAGTDYTQGVTTKLTLSRTPGGPDNVRVFFDAYYQGDGWSIAGNQITFDAPIPVASVFVETGTTLSLFTPPVSSVGDPQLVWGNTLGRVVDSIADLRDLNKSRYTRAFVTGYYAPHDGGGGSYQFDPLDVSSADNGGTVIIADDGGRWKLQHYGTVTARQFGVKADNVTDDYAALAKACASGPTGVRDLIIPAGHIYSSKTIDLTNLAQIGFPLRITGAGMLRDDGGNTAGTVLRIEPGAGKNCVEQMGSQFITWQDVKIVSTGPSGGSAGFVVTRTAQADFAQNNAFYRCMVIMDRPGANCFYNNCAEQADVRGCWFEGPRPFIWALAAEGAPTTQYAAINNATFSNTCHSVDNNTFVATDGPGMWLIGVGTLNGGGNLIKKAGGNTYPHGILLQSSGAGYQSNFNMRFHAQVEDFDHAARLEGQTFGVQFDLSLSNIQSHAFSLGPASVHYSPRLAANLLNTPGAFNAVSADPSGANIFGGQFTIPPNAIQVDTNLGLRGTDVDATNHDTSNPAVFSVAAGSSFTVRGQNTHIRAKAAWNPGSVATGGPSAPFDVAVPGAAIGDRVDVTWPYAAKGCQVYGSVDTAGQVRLVIINITGAPVVFGAGTFPITVSRQPFAN